MKQATTWRSFSTTNLTLTGGLGVVGGIWLIISPYLFDYSGYAANATLLGIVAGVVTIALSGFCILTEKMPAMQTYRFYAGIALVAMGVLLMAGPYLLNYNQLRDPLWNLQLTGAVFILIAGFVVQELYTRSREEAVSY